MIDNDKRELLTVAKRLEEDVKLVQLKNIHIDREKENLYRKFKEFENEKEMLNNKKARVEQLKMDLSIKYQTLEVPQYKTTINEDSSGKFTLLFNNYLSNTNPNFFSTTRLKSTADSRFNKTRNNLNKAIIKLDDLEQIRSGVELPLNSNDKFNNSKFSNYLNQERANLIKFSNDVMKNNIDKYIPNSYMKVTSQPIGFNENLESNNIKLDYFEKHKENKEASVYNSNVLLDHHHDYNIIEKKVITINEKSITKTKQIIFDKEYYFRIKQSNNKENIISIM